MNPYKQIKKNVVDGLVLNKKKEWVSLSEKVEREHAIIHRLSIGMVIWSGEWMSIADAKWNIECQKAPKNDPFFSPEETRVLLAQPSFGQNTPANKYPPIEEDDDDDDVFEEINRLKRKRMLLYGVIAASLLLSIIVVGLLVL
jgi:hypothetical protein